LKCRNARPLILSSFGSFPVWYFAEGDRSITKNYTLLSERAFNDLKGGMVRSNPTGFPTMYCIVVDTSHFGQLLLGDAEVAACGSALVACYHNRNHKLEK
jgi:hypothetical protein